MWPFKRKLKIVSFGYVGTGCWVARIQRPLTELGKKHLVKLTDGMTPISTNGWDIVVFNNLTVSPEEMEGRRKVRESSLVDMMNAFRENGAKIVYDTDDAQDIIPEHTLNRQRASKDVLDSFETYLKNADLITTTTPTLAEYLRTKTNKPIEVLPNCMNVKDFPQREKFERLRIGLAGSVSHIKDILIPLDAIRELQKKYDFAFYIFGFSKLPLKQFALRCGSADIATAARTLQRSLKGIEYSWVPPVSAKEYPLRLAELGFDIGIAPLEDTPFNRNKSCIKFYEYALVGTPTVASDVLPYSEEPMLKVKNEFHDWYYKLEGLILNQKMREDLAKEQRDWVLEHRDISKMAKQWEKAYRKII